MNTTANEGEGAKAPDSGPIEVIYLGRHVSPTTGAANLIFAHASELPKIAAGETGERGYWKSDSKTTKGLMVGCLYTGSGTMEQGRLQTLAVGRLDFVRSADIPNGILAGLKMADRAGDAILRAKSLQAKIKADDPLAREMQFLRKLYQRTRYQDRPALEVLVLKCLREEVV